MSAEAVIGQGGPSPGLYMQQAGSPNGLSPQSAASSALTRVNRVEDVLSRETAVYVISLFFDYVSVLNHVVNPNVAETDLFHLTRCW